MFNPQATSFLGTYFLSMSACISNTAPLRMVLPQCDTKSAFRYLTEQGAAVCAAINCSQMEIGKTAKWLTVKLAHQVEILAASQTAKPLYCWPVPSTNPQAQESQVTNLVADSKFMRHQTVKTYGPHPQQNMFLGYH